MPYTCTLYIDCTPKWSTSTSTTADKFSCAHLPSSTYYVRMYVSEGRNHTSKKRGMPLSIRVNILLGDVDRLCSFRVKSTNTLYLDAITVKVWQVQSHYV
jgi:hypothetical protein